MAVISDYSGDVTVNSDYVGDVTVISDYVRDVTVISDYSGDVTAGATRLLALHPWTNGDVTGTRMTAGMAISEWEGKE